MQPPQKPPALPLRYPHRLHPVQRAGREGKGGSGLFVWWQTCPFLTLFVMKKQNVEKLGSAVSRIGRGVLTPEKSSPEPLQREEKWRRAKDLLRSCERIPLGLSPTGKPLVLWLLPSPGRNPNGPKCCTSDCDTVRPLGGQRDSQPTPLLLHGSGTGSCWDPWGSDSSPGHCRSPWGMLWRDHPYREPPPTSPLTSTDPARAD